MKINISGIIGFFLSLTMAYNLWGIKGFWFTFGLLLTNGYIKITYESRN